MNQLSLFDEKNDDNVIEIVIPKEVISPLESNKRIGSRDFREQQLEFIKYIRSIQYYRNCSWFEARELFFKHRDSYKPIKVKKDIKWNLK